MEIIYLPALIVFGIVGFFAATTIGAALWEQRLVQPYYVPEPSNQYVPTEPALRANREAQSLGFTHRAVCHDRKGKLYTVRYDFWISLDSKTIAEIGSGTVAKFPVFGIWLYSCSGDGKALCTTNEIGEQDISGVVQQQTFPGSQFSELMDRHSEELVLFDAEPFSQDSPLSEFIQINAMKAQALDDRGYARYTNGERNAWKYTIFGAFAFYYTSVWVRPISRGLRRFGLSRG